LEDVSEFHIVSQRVLAEYATFFCDISLDKWISFDPPSRVTFSRVSELARQPKQREQLRNELLRLATSSETTTMQQLQAWSLLRSVTNYTDPIFDKQLLGVVVEVGVPHGPEIVATYEDRTAFYLHHTGGGVAWHRPTIQLDARIAEVLSAASAILGSLEVWRNARRPPPGKGFVRLNLLTPAGVCFGEGT
jgi:hypothetical protein